MKNQPCAAEDKPDQLKYHHTEPAVDLVLDAGPPLHLEDAAAHGRGRDHALQHHVHDQDAEVADEVPPQLANAPYRRAVYLRGGQHRHQRRHPNEVGDEQEDSRDHQVIAADAPASTEDDDARHGEACGAAVSGDSLRSPRRRGHQGHQRPMSAPPSAAHLSLAPRLAHAFPSQGRKFCSSGSPRHSSFPENTQHHLLSGCSSFRLQAAKRDSAARHKTTTSVNAQHSQRSF